MIWQWNKRRVSLEMKMSELLQKRLASLLSVKSLITLALTFVFVFLSVKGEVNQFFQVTYTTIIGFYFGYQANPNNTNKDGDGGL